MKIKTSPSVPARGFTLVELLVVIAIIGTLMSMLLPAVQGAREAARRTLCGNHLKEIALGMLQYHEAKQSLPPSTLGQWMDGHPNAPAGAWASWYVLILPHIGEQGRFDLWDMRLPYRYQYDGRGERVKGKGLDQHLLLKTGLDNFICPSRPRRPESVLRGQTFSKWPAGKDWERGTVGDYAANSGAINWPDPKERKLTAKSWVTTAATGTIIPGTPKFGSISYLGKGINCKTQGLLRKRDCISTYDSNVSIRMISDGPGNTFLVGEKHILRHRLLRFREDAAIYNATNYEAVARRAQFLPRNPQDTTSTQPRGVNPLGNSQKEFETHETSFGSWHPHIVQFAFADGHVRQLSTTVSRGIIRRFCNRGDGQIVDSALLD